MSESGYSIDNLIRQDYSENYRKVTVIPGGALRYIDTSDALDMIRFRQLMNKVGDKKDDGLDDIPRTDRQLRNMAKSIVNYRPPHSILRFAVTSTDSSKINGDEIGELQGYLRFMRADKDDIKELIKYYPKYANRNNVFDIAYKRLNEAPPGQGLVSGALRAACMQVRAMTVEVERTRIKMENERRRKAGINNLAPNENEDADPLILAFVDPERGADAEASRNVLRSLDFEQIGNMMIRGKPSDERWILNWEEFDKKTQDRFPKIDDSKLLELGKKTLIRQQLRKNV